MSHKVTIKHDFGMEYKGAIRVFKTGETLDVPESDPLAAIAKAGQLAAFVGKAPPAHPAPQEPVTETEKPRGGNS